MGRPDWYAGAQPAISPIKAEYSRPYGVLVSQSHFSFCSILLLLFVKVLEFGTL
jgi:hypothetical protein